MKNRLLIIDDQPDICEIVSGSRMHEAIEPQTRSEKNGVAMRFGITRRFGLRIPASAAAGGRGPERPPGGSARRGRPPRGPAGADPLAPWGRLSLRGSVIKPTVVIGNAVVPRVNCGQVIARCNPSILPRIQPSSMLHFSRDIRVHSLRILLGGPRLSSAPRGVESIQGGSASS